MGASFIGYIVAIPHRDGVPEATINRVRARLSEALHVVEKMRRACWEFLPEGEEQGSPAEPGWGLLRARDAESATLLFEAMTPESALPGGHFREAYLRACTDPAVGGWFTPREPVWWVLLGPGRKEATPENAPESHLARRMGQLAGIESAALHLARRWELDGTETVEAVVDRVIGWVRRIDGLDFDTNYAVHACLQAHKVLTLGQFRYDGDVPMSSEYAVLALLVSVPGVMDLLGWEL